MIKIDITIPLFYNDKTPIEQIKLEKIQRELRTKFGGLSISGNIQGQWYNNEDLNVYYDTNQIYTVVGYDDDIISWIRGYKLWLEHNLEQKEIFILISEVTKID